MTAMTDKKQMFEIARKNLNPYQAAGHVETFQSNANLGGGLSIVDLAGHTPGHSGVRISDGKDQLLIWGDVVHVPSLQFAHPDDIEVARAARKKIFDEVSSDRIRIAGMHLCFPAIGHVGKNGRGYEFVPQMWENII